MKVKRLVKKLLKHAARTNEPESLQGIKDRLKRFVEEFGRKKITKVSREKLIAFYGSFHGLGASSVIDPSLATNLTYIIQGLIVLFIGADVLILSVWNSRKKVRWRWGSKTVGAPT